MIRNPALTMNEESALLVCHGSKYFFSPNEGRQDCCILDLDGIDRENIPVDHYEIG
jgi:hypothetical protein